MKAWWFQQYLRLQALLREAGFMRQRPLWKVSRWVYRHLRCPRVIAVRCKGRSWWLDTADEYFTQGMVLTGVHEDWEVRIFQEWLRPGMVVVDVGAHVGYYTVISAQGVGPTGRVVAFEPEPENRQLLRRNIAANRCGNVEVVPKAVMNQPGSVTLWLASGNLGGHRTTSSWAGERSLAVEATSLDAFFAREAVALDIVKIDVEGAEWQVWQGMQGLLRWQRIRRVFVEIWPEQLSHFGVTLEEWWRQIGAYGLQGCLIAEDQGGRLVPSSPAQVRARAQAREYAQVFLVPAPQTTWRSPS
jgi:FkbM family methyltransferase